MECSTLLYFHGKVLLKSPKDGEGEWLYSFGPHTLTTSLETRESSIVGFFFVGHKVLSTTPHPEIFPNTSTYSTMMLQPYVDGLFAILGPPKIHDNEMCWKCSLDCFVQVCSEVMFFPFLGHCSILTQEAQQCIGEE